MDFRPTNVHFIYNQDGYKTRVETWDYDTIAGWELIGNIMNIFVMMFMFVLVSPYFLYLAIADFNGKFNLLTPVGIIIGSIVIYDGLNGGFIVTLLSIFAAKWLIILTLKLNTIAVITHFYLMVLGVFTHKFIVKWYDTEQARINAFIVLMMIVIGCGKLYSEKLFKDIHISNQNEKVIDNQENIDENNLFGISNGKLNGEQRPGDE